MSISLRKPMCALVSVWIGLNILVSCSGRDDICPAKIMRFDRSIVSYSELDSAGKVAFSDTFQAVADVLAKILTVGETKNATDSFLEDYSKSPKMLYYVPGIEERLGSLDTVETMLGVAYGNISNAFPSIRLPEIYGVVLTYNQSVVLADSVLLVGLNHYLGTDYEPYAYFSSYQRYGKQKRFIPYNLVEAIISSAYPYRPSSEATALSRMIYEGALAESVMSVLESSDEALALGYSPDQLVWLSDNEKNIWNAMIEKDLVYSTDRMVADRLVRPAPSTSIVNPDAPGRLGRFVGLRIVQSYLRNYPGVELATLLDSAFYNSPQVLVRSNYYP